LIAESELGILAAQCLDRRISDKQTLIGEIAAWEHDRNAQHTPARLGLALAKDFLLFGLAATRFAALPFTDLEFLRALTRAVDFPLRAVARFSR
jgi:hypothetical protein